MKTLFNIKNLTHHLLIATPQMNDDWFGDSVVYICRHDEQGALGLIINKPLINSTVSRLFDGLGIDVNNNELHHQHPLDSGPVHPEVGFVLHTGQAKWASSFTISENVCVTTSRDILIKIANGQDTPNFKLCLGHASWDKQQLLDEIEAGDWLIAPANLELLFHTEFEDIWHKSGQQIGIDLNFFSSNIGHA